MADKIRTTTLRPGDVVVRDPFPVPEWAIFDRATVVRSDAKWTIVESDEQRMKVATMHLLLKERPDAE